MLLAYEDLGRGPVVVLLHGFPLDRSMWSEQTRVLAQTHRVIVPDLRGHGASAEFEAPFTIDEMADDVIETLDALGVVDPVTLGGLSMGGYIALAAVLRQPARVRALMLMDTRAEGDSADAAKARESLARQVESTGSTAAVVDGMIPKLFAASTLERRPEVVAAIRSVMEKLSPRSVAASLRALAIRPDRTAALATITVPTLVLVGSEDAITPPSAARTIATGIPGARLEIIPGAGHMAPLEAPEVCNPLILSFLAGHG